MYSMWNANFIEVYKNIKRKQEGLPTTLEPFYFVIDKDKPKCKFKIEELDSLTSRFKDETSFVKELSKYGDKYLYSYPNTPIMITHTANGKIYEDSIIYNDRLITNIALEIKKKKQNKKEKTKVVIDTTDDLLDFIEYIKSLAIHPVSSKYLLNSEKLPSTVGVELKYLLRKTIKDDVELNDRNNYQKRVRGLRSILKEYINYSDLLREKELHNQSTLEVEEYFDKVSQELITYFKKDYKNIRNFIVWEDLYKKALKKQIDFTENKEERVKLQYCLEYTRLQKLYRNERLDPSEWEWHYDSYINQEMPFEESEKRISDIQNEEMLNLYQEGGLEAVMEQMDADEIYKNIDDAKALGIIKSNKK